MQVKDFRLDHPSGPLIELGNVVESVDFTTTHTGNSMYIATTHAKRKKAMLVKAAGVYAMQHQLQQQVERFPGDIINGIFAYSCKVSSRMPFLRWTFKNGKLRKIDLTNIWKPAEDGLATAMGVDDSLCIDIQLVKQWEDDLEDKECRLVFDMKLFARKDWVDEAFVDRARKYFAEERSRDSNIVLQLPE